MNKCNQIFQRYLVLSEMVK